MMPRMPIRNRCTAVRVSSLGALYAQAQEISRGEIPILTSCLGGLRSTEDSPEVCLNEVHSRYIVTVYVEGALKPPVTGVSRATLT